MRLVFKLVNERVNVTFNELKYRKNLIKREPPYTAGGNVNWCSHYGKRNMEVPQEAKEKAIATHSSTLAWKIPWTEEPGGLQSMGSRRVGHD